MLAVLNSLLGTATGILVFKLARVIAGARAANCAVLLYCLEPSTFHYSTVVMTEMPFTFCLTLSLWFLYRTLERGMLSSAMASGVWMGIATLVRPILFFAFAPVAITICILSIRANNGLRRSLTLGAVVLCAAVLSVAPWQLRNWVRTGDASLSQVENANLYFFDAAAVLGRLSGESVQIVQQRLGMSEFTYRFGFAATEAEAFGSRRYTDLYPSSATASVVELGHGYRDRALAVLRAHPWAALRVRARALALLLAAPNTIFWSYHYGWFHPDAEFRDLYLYPHLLDSMRYLFHTNRKLFLASLALFLPVLAIYFLALWGLKTMTEPLRALLSVLLAYLFLVSSVPGGPDDRLRVPMFPMLCVMAGIGVASLRQKPGPIRAKPSPAER